LLRAEGLVELGLIVTPQLVGDGGPVEAIWRTALERSRERMLDLRLITEQEFAEGLALLGDPSFVKVAMLLISAWGRRPAEPEGAAGGS
jgi:hypothetical protein